MPALDGMRILDMTQYEAGTSGTQALAWLGADVVKVEPPSGDPGREVQPGPGDSPYFVNLNSNKRSLVLDLQDPRGRETLLAMAPHYDVFVENYAPGVVEKLDLGYEVLRAANPRIIYARLKGFGLSGPYAAYKSFDPIAQATGGGFSVTGRADGPPVSPGPMTGDSGTGIQLALAITAAYVQRQRTGRGQLIEISMQEAMTFYMRTRASTGGFNERPAPRGGSGVATLRMYACAPGGPNDHVFIMCVTDRMWDALCIGIERPDLPLDPRFETDALRQENHAALYEEIAPWIAARDKHEVMRILGEVGAPCGAVLDTEELFADPHLRERGFIQKVEHPVHGELDLLGWAPRLSDSDVPFAAAPLLGAHSEEVLQADLGLGDADLAELRESGVVG